MSSQQPKALGALVARAERPEVQRPAAPPFPRTKHAPHDLTRRELDRAPWLGHALRHSETFALLVQEARRWRLAFFLLLLGAVCPMTFGLVSLASRARVVPYIVQVDKHGFAVPIKLAEEGAPVPGNVVHSALWNWMFAMRTLQGDDAAQRHLRAVVFAHLSNATTAQKKATAWLNEVRVERAKGKRVEVVMGLVAPIPGSKTVWKVEWTEYEHWSDSGSTKLTRYSSLVTVSISPVRRNEDIGLNPLGVFVTDYSMSQMQ